MSILVTGNFGDFRDAFAEEYQEELTVSLAVANDENVTELSSDAKQ